MTEEFLKVSTIGLYFDESKDDYILFEEFIKKLTELGYKIAIYHLKSNTNIKFNVNYNFYKDDEDENIETSHNNFQDVIDKIIYISNNIDSEMKNKIDQNKIIQGSYILDITSDNAIIKSFCEEYSINIAPYKMVSTLEEIKNTSNELGFPIEIKSILEKNNNKTDNILRGEWDLGNIAKYINGNTLIAESLIENAKTYSMTIVRNINGEYEYYPICEISKYKEQYDKMWTLDKINNEFRKEYYKISNTIGDITNYIGAYSIEIIVNENGVIYLNDIKIGLDNSMMIYNIATNVSVIDQHIRAVSGQALRAVKPLTPTIKMPILRTQLTDIYKYWPIKSNWIINLTDVDGQDELVGHVFIIEKNLKDVLNSIEAVNIW